MEENNKIPENLLEKLKEKFTNFKEEYIFRPEATMFSQDDLNKLLKHCSDIGVADINIEGHKFILGDIDKRIYPLTMKKINDNEAAKLLKKIYDDNAIARIYSIEAIDTSYSMVMDGKTYRFRVNAVGSRVGGNKTVQITIRTLPDIPPKMHIIKRGDPISQIPKGTLPLEEDIWESFCPEQGLAIVTGPTGSGKSTLLAGCIRKIAEQPNINKKIITYEAPIEFVYDKCDTPSCIISQTEIGTQLKTFYDGIESGMRRKPNIILVGESRDPETIDSSLLASQTGHLVYTTAHTNTVSETVSRLINVFPENERHAKLIDMIDSLQIIVAQRLVKTSSGGICAVKEYLVFDKQVKKTLRDSSPITISKNIDQIVTEKRQRLIDDIYNRHLEGMITEEEFNRLNKDYGPLTISDDDLFNDVEEDIKYLTINDFLNYKIEKDIYAGLFVDPKSSNHGKIVFCESEKMSLDNFIKSAKPYIYDSYSNETFNNKEIAVNIKSLFFEKKNKNKK